MAKITSRLLVCMILLGTFLTAGYADSGNRVIVLNDGKQRAWLGVELQDITTRLKERKDLTTTSGAYVDAVVEDSPAEKAGIKDGDVIVKFDGTTIDDSDDLTRAVKRTPPKTDVKIEVLRKAERKTITATLGRQRAPEAYSYHFNTPTPRMPLMPRMPKMPSLPREPFSFHFYSHDDMYGLDLQGMTKQLGEYFDIPGGKGLLVSEVESGSKAEKAGFKAGDVITKVNGRSVRDMEDFHEELADSKDSSASFEVVRKGKTITLSMKVERDNDWDDEEEDDDDYSMNFERLTPMPNHDRSWLRDKEFLVRQQMDILYEKLMRLKDHLRAKFEQFRDDLKNELTDL